MAATALSALLAACGGGTGSQRDSGADKTYLNVDASDDDGDGLQYQWRVTAGSIENRNASQTVWTMPNGPGLHFAYVTVSDGRGGYVEQQYAVSTDPLDTSAATPQPVSHTPPAPTSEGATMRLRFASPNDTRFAVASGTPQARIVYLPDVQVQVTEVPGGKLVFSGSSDSSGEIDLPQLRSGQRYAIRCASSQGRLFGDCGAFTAGSTAFVLGMQPALGATQNLRLFGHVGLADGGVCGRQNEFFAIESAASVQLQQADGTALSSPLRVNRFGDYALDAAVPVKAVLKLKVQCEGYSATLDVPAGADPAGYLGTAPVELSHVIANNRPRIVKVVANGADGNVRGQMVLPAADAPSNDQPGAAHFLTYKGADTKLSACAYYRALGAVKDCDAQGAVIEPISLDDWKRKNKFVPYGQGNEEVSANYINRTDLNLVRRMVATQVDASDSAFVVCNHPGPDGTSQEEVDQRLASGLADEKRVACVAMEWSPSPGANGGKPFTKFYTFGPDGTLIASINLDGRGEKYMPGACVACHGGSTYSGRFPDTGSPSPYLGARFLPFDTGNYYFASDARLTEAAQGLSLRKLNDLVRATEPSDSTATSRLIQGWYANGGNTLDKSYVPPAWLAADAVPATAGAARFYREVVGISCRTCHASLGARFDWDSTVLSPARAQARVCGGTADVAINATMPNALISHDRLLERVRGDPSLAALMKQFLGCDGPAPDPAYPLR